MANLIIKPSTGGSNTLILQDEGGDAALTIGATGSTTLAGTANNLGTITNATVFPTSPVSNTGHVLQVVQTVYTSPETATCNDADVDTSFTCTITPQFNTSKIMISGHACVGTGGNFSGFGIGIKKGSTVIGTPTSGGDNAQSRFHSGWANTNTLGSGAHVATAPFNFLDSPTTTSATTYKLFFRGVSGVTTIYLNRTSSDGNEWTSVMTLMEIGA